ncbi:CgeB family protein [Lutibaculum baratangense]|uniref:Spore protein YkvP/CgeB glycosyl transferase-like domain-containing protein n=1 Tax=Lutibaculum baratangense AMV1 TaxID=631454 RepID=V4QZW3_9HYPH|nr:glycosyltransferase [Lutibaculum baratangense]ESR25302.1 hypothetical protein N177_1819 [Lutibaculum baratangense AMV1]
MRIAFYGSSLVSAYWNGAATYYRGLIRNLAALGHEVTFYEPDAYDRQKNRDMDPPDWARVVVYDANEDAVNAVLAEAAQADIVVKASGVGVFDDELFRGILEHGRDDALKIFWDVDAPATLADLAADPGHMMHALLPQLDAVLTYGGGDPVVEAYRGFGARHCAPVYNALDPETHHPVPHDERFACDLAFLGNRLPDREARVEEFFFKPARMLPHRRFLLGGSGWEPHQLPENVRHIGHVSTRDHNAFNTTPLAVLNVARDSMAKVGFSPATRVFEAAGAGGCLITDHWQGLELFLEPGREALVAETGEDVARLLEGLDRDRAGEIGRAGRARIMAEHTYARRAEQVDGIFRSLRDVRSSRERKTA